MLGENAYTIRDASVQGSEDTMLPGLLVTDLL